MSFWVLGLVGQLLRWSVLEASASLLKKEILGLFFLDLLLLFSVDASSSSSSSSFSSLEDLSLLLESLSRERLALPLLFLLSSDYKLSKLQHYITIYLLSSYGYVIG